MLCKYCGKEIADGSIFCKYCGEELVVLCKYCAKKIVDDSVFCAHCGKRVPLTTDVKQEEIANGVEDKYGVVYSKDGKRLLSCKNTELTEYTVKAGTEVICNLAFSGHRRLQSIELPEGLTGIGDWAFEGCDGLTSMEMPKGLISIGNGAFKACFYLSTIILPAGLTYIEYKAFFMCCSLVAIELPESVIYIGDRVFIGSRDLNKVYIKCSAGANKAAVIEKFKRLLPERLHNKIIIKKPSKYQKLFPPLPLFEK